jgi:uncharacterized protein (TIGR03083 family)
MTGLAGHLAAVHGRTITICRDLPTERPSAPHLPEGTDPITWFEESLGEMLEMLDAADPEALVWGFWPRSSIGLWQRRMVIETGVHRWDADQAFGEESGLSDIVSRSGLDEFNDMWLPRLGELPPLEASATDLGLVWVLGNGAPVSALEGTGSDIYLRLMSRPSPVSLPPVWAEAVDALEPPRR